MKVLRRNYKIEIEIVKLKHERTIITKSFLEHYKSKFDASTRDNINKKNRMQNEKLMK